MVLSVERLLDKHEDHDDPLSRSSLSLRIKETALALTSPFHLRRIAVQDRMQQYSNEELAQHYTNHRRQYQQFYDMYHGKKRISEGEVMAAISFGRRGVR